MGAVPAVGNSSVLKVYLSLSENLRPKTRKPWSIPLGHQFRDVPLKKNHKKKIAPKVYLSAVQT